MCAHVSVQEGGEGEGKREGEGGSSSRKKKTPHKDGGGKKLNVAGNLKGGNLETSQM